VDWERGLTVQVAHLAVRAVERGSARATLVPRRDGVGGRVVDRGVELVVDLERVIPSNWPWDVEVPRVELDDEITKWRAMMAVVGHERWRSGRERGWVSHLSVIERLPQ
jgi:hypothetical protein